MAYICVSKLATIGSDNVLSPGRRQAIIWTNAGILLIGSVGTNFGEILIGIYKVTLKNAFENVVTKLAAILARPQYIKYILCGPWWRHQTCDNMSALEAWNLLHYDN